MVRRLLAVLAHPDDESFGIGGTLARYAREGVEVHVAIATDGVAGSVVDEYKETMGELVSVRMRELEAAVEVLGGHLHRFCYRDSGYVGDAANAHPEAFIQADEYEAIGRVVRLIRQVRPDVIITHDEKGGYFHPDHIFCWKIVTPAFSAAADPAQYPEFELEPFQPKKLYYTAIPEKWVRIFAWLMRLRGQDPTRIGRNKDIDMTRVGVPKDQIHSVIDFSDYWEIKAQASAQHSSQGGGTGFTRLLPIWLQKRLLSRESFTRAYPPAQNGQREEDLFADVR